MKWHSLAQILFGLLLVSCTKDSTNTFSDSDVAARVGNHVITKDDFIRRTEYTVRPDYCKGSHYISKKIMMNSLITEKMFAIEAEKSGFLENNKAFKRYIKGRREQAMRQFYYYDQAYSMVTLDSTEIQQLFAIAGRTIRVAYYTLPDEIFAQKTQIALDDGFTFEDIYSLFDNTTAVPEKDIDWTEIEDKVVLDHLFNNDLKRGDVIGPIETTDGSYILMKVQGWRDDSAALTEKVAGERYNKVIEHLKNQKALLLFKKNISGLMRGKTLNFDETIFKEYVRALGDWYLNDGKNKKLLINQSIGLEDDNITTYTGHQFPEDLMDENFVQMDDQWFSVREFQQILESHPLVFRRKTINKSEFAEETQKAIADLFQDLELNKECYRLEYDKEIVVQQNVSMWQDYYLAKAFRNNMIAEADPDSTLLSNESMLIEEVLNPIVNDLQKKYNDQTFIAADWLEDIGISTIDMSVIQPQMPYSVMVPAFPKMTTDTRLDYGQSL